MEKAKLWELYTSTIGVPQKNVSDEEKEQLLQTVLHWVDGNYPEAIRYLEGIKASWHPDAPRIGVCCFEPSGLIQIPNGLCCSFNAPRRAFNAARLNLTMLKFFITQCRSPPRRRLQCMHTPFTSLAQVLLKASVSNGNRKVLRSRPWVQMAVGGNARG